MKLSLHDGDGHEYASIELGAPDNNGILNEAELTYGHLFIAIDGQEYGSLALSEVIPGGIRPVGAAESAHRARDRVSVLRLVHGVTHGARSRLPALRSGGLDELHKRHRHA